MHYQFDTTEVIGGDWSGVGISTKRLGSAFAVDWSEIAMDVLTFGLRKHAWDNAHSVPEHELFGSYTADGFDPARWKEEYPNLAFRRMTEHDAAWMARILARFTPEMLRALVARGLFTRESDAKYLAEVLEARLQRILERYLLRLSPITDVRVEPGDQLCAVDLAELRGLRAAGQFHYVARAAGSALGVTHRARGELCAALIHQPHTPYVVVSLEDGVARGRLLAHLYDLGPAGFRLVGLERPEP